MRYKTEEEQLAAVKQDGYAIYYIDNPSEAVQLEAVKEAGHAIVYIDNPSEKIQLEAVKQNGRAVVCIKNPTEAAQLIAVEFINELYKNITSEKAKRKFYKIRNMQEALG